MRVLMSRVTSLFQRRRLDADLEDELQAHLELAVQENLQRGMTAEEARTAALRSFGGVTQTRETYRIQRGLPWIEQLGRDARFAVRQLRKSPGFALTAILTLALGIGAAASVFSVVHAVLLKPFAFRDPERLMVIREVQVRGERDEAPFNYRHFLRLQKAVKSLEEMAIFENRSLSLSTNSDHPHMVGGVAGSPNLLAMLGIQPILGRGLTESDAAKGAAPVLLLSYNAWQTIFQGRSDVIGQSLQLSGKPVTIVGVLPANLRFPRIALAPKIEYSQTSATREVQVYLPYVPSPLDLSEDMGMFNWKVIGRLRDDVSPAQATAEMETLQGAYSAAAHLPLTFGIAVAPLAKDASAPVSGALWVLFAAVCAVLLIACVNLANLQLARAVNAEHETAVRAALGAGRAQLVTARLMESVLLAVAGGVAGVGLAFLGVRLLVALAPANLPRVDEVRMSLSVLGFATAVSMLSAIAFGLLPALRSLRVPPQDALKANATRTAGAQAGQRTRNGMVAGQVACTVVLLIVTSLTLRSFSRLMHEDRGFDSGHVTYAQANLLSPQYDDTQKGYAEAKLDFTSRALAALRRLPGVTSVALTSAAPMTGETWVDEMERPDHPVRESDRPLINVRWISPDYLSTMRIPLVAGRNLAESDKANPSVVLISEEAARVGFPGENPVGKTLDNIIPYSDNNKPATIVGVVADARVNGLKDRAAMVYLPYWTYVPWNISFLVRGERPSNAMIPEIRRVLWEIDPQVTLAGAKSLDEQVSDSVAEERFQAIVLGCFGAAALLLALLGVYGVLAYSVSLRWREFGIRIALGSGKGTLVGLVLRQAAWPVLAGAGIGLAIAFAAMRWVRSLLYEAPAMDPVAIGGSVLLLLVAAAIAAIVPARRAASIDPMRALRME